MDGNNNNAFTDKETLLKALQEAVNKKEYWEDLAKVNTSTMKIMARVIDSIQEVIDEDNKLPNKEKITIIKATIEKLIRHLERARP